MSLKDTFGMDMAFVVSYAEYHDRIGPMRRELARVGIGADTEFVHTFRNPFDDLSLGAIRHNDKIRNNHSFYNLTMGHYSALKTAEALGVDRVLMMEDDCRFMNDTGKIRETMARVPCDWEVLMLDSFKLLDEDRGKTGWLPCMFARSSACYCLNRSGVRKLVSLIESCIHDRNARLKNIDGYFDPHELFEIAKGYRSYPNVAVQADTSLSVSGINSRMYRAIGIDCSNYAGFEPAGA